MAKDIANWLRMYAQQFEDQHAPDNLTIGMREAADEIERLRAGGCARDQSTTQYCAEAARLAQENEQNRIDLEEYRRDVERLRAYALKAFTVVEFCCGEGFLLSYPHYDCDDLIMEGVDLLKVESSEEARAALKEPRT